MKEAFNAQKTVLLTGAAGFIGSNVLEYLYTKYPTYRFIVIDALTYAGKLEHIPDHIRNSERFSFHHEDVQNQAVVDSLVAESDMVVHFAAETHVEHSIYDNTRFFETDILGTLSVCNAVLAHEKRVDRFIHISTCEVYGAGLTDYIDEDHLLNPHSPYAAAKAGADRLVFSYWKTYGIPAIILRPFNIFGPRQHLEKLIPRFVSSCLLEKNLTVHGHGKAGRDFMYVDGVSDMVDKLLHAPREKVIGEIFNAGSGKAISVLDVAKAVASHMKCPSDRFVFVPDRPGQVSSFAAEYGKAKRVLGWTPPLDFDEGLQKTIAWYRDNKPIWEDQIESVPSLSGTIDDLDMPLSNQELSPESSHSRIKILFGINKLSVGGAERLLVNQIVGMDKKRFDPHLVTLLPSTKPNFDDSVTFLGSKWKKFQFAGLLDVFSWFSLVSYLKREKFDVVITNLFLTNFLLRTAAIVAGVPLIFSTELNVYEKRSPVWVKIEQWLAPYTHKIIAVSRDVIESASKQLSLPKDKFILNYSTVNLKDIRPATLEERAKVRAKYSVPKDAFVISTAGRLVEQKGQRFLIEAFASLGDKEAHLFVFGEGARRPDLEEAVKNHGLEHNIHLPGAVSIKDIVALSDIFVLPSLWEGMPLILLEAMAGGLPIVATNISGARELIEDGNNGFLVPPKDAGALKEKILLLKNDTALKTSFRETSLKGVQKFSIENHLSVLYDTIHKGLTEKDA